jgi:hypothetical protein
MATKRSLKSVSSNLLNPTEHKAISKLMKIHEPLLKEAEKWKEQREKLENTLLDQIDTIGKILEPYYDQTRTKLLSMARQQPSAKSPNRKSTVKKTTSRKTTGRKKSSARKSK